MVKIFMILTKHAKNKLRTVGARKFRITKRKLEMVINNPVSYLEQAESVIVAVGSLDLEHSLCVVYKTEGDIIKIITFFPAKKGRYET